MKHGSTLIYITVMHSTIGIVKSLQTIIQKFKHSRKSLLYMYNNGINILFKFPNYDKAPDISLVTYL